ncbi:MAG: hypothetical protein ACXIVQ_03860 [Acidimicrobiales bacterium]
MKTLDAQTAGRTALAAAARPLIVDAATRGNGLGMYPCEWRARAIRVSTFSTPIFADTSHKAWRPKESSS